MPEANLITAVVNAVAAADGVEPAEVDVLYEYVDPGVLRKLDEQERGKWSFTFRFADHQVTVTHDTEILVDGVSYTSDASAS